MFVGSVWVGNRVDIWWKLRGSVLVEFLCNVWVKIPGGDGARFFCSAWAKPLFDALVGSDDFHSAIVVGVNVVADS